MNRSAAVICVATTTEVGHSTKRQSQLDTRPEPADIFGVEVSSVWSTSRGRSSRAQYLGSHVSGRVCVQPTVTGELCLTSSARVFHDYLVQVPSGVCALIVVAHFDRLGHCCSIPATWSFSAECIDGALLKIVSVGVVERSFVLCIISRVSQANSDVGVCSGVMYVRRLKPIVMSASVPASCMSDV